MAKPKPFKSHMRIEKIHYSDNVRVREFRGRLMSHLALSTTRTDTKYLCVGGAADGQMIYGQGSTATVRLRNESGQPYHSKYTLCRVLTITGSADHHVNFYCHDGMTFEQALLQMVKHYRDETGQPVIKPPTQKERMLGEICDLIGD